MEKQRSEQAIGETKEGKNEDYYIHSILFASIIALIMAYVQRTSVSSLLEKWRAHVFLALNLVLLAVFLTSPSAGHNNSRHQSKGCDEHHEGAAADHEMNLSCCGKTKTCKCSRSSNINAAVADSKAVECDNRGESEVNVGTNEGNSSSKDKKVDGNCFEVGSLRVVGRNSYVEMLSQEELNERSEAFIAMFKQHLLSDIGRSASKNRFSSHRQRLLFHEETRK